MQTTMVPTMSVLSKTTGEEVIVNVGDFDPKLHKVKPAEEEDDAKTEKPSKATRSKLMDDE